MTQSPRNLYGRDGKFLCLIKGHGKALFFRATSALKTLRLFFNLFTFSEAEPFAAILIAHGTHSLGGTPEA